MQISTAAASAASAALHCRQRKLGTVVDAINTSLTWQDVTFTFCGVLSNCAPEKRRKEQKPGNKKQNKTIGIELHASVYDILPPRWNGAGKQGLECERNVTSEIHN